MTNISDEPELAQLHVRFDLPFVLRLADSIKEEHRTTSTNDYGFKSNQGTAWFRFHKHAVQRPDLVAAIEDHGGKLSYSTVEIVFAADFIAQQRIPRDYVMVHKVIEDRAIAFVNEFLDIYCQATSSFWVRPIASRDVVSFAFMGFYVDGTSRTFHSGSLGNGRSIYTLISEQQELTIRNALAAPSSPVGDLQRFAWTVSELLDRRELWTACVAIEVLFEAKVGHLLRDCYLKRGIAAPDIEGLFRREGSRGPKSISRLVRDLAHELDLDLTVAETRALRDEWQRAAARLRNELVHGARTKVTTEEAVDAWNAVKAFLARLETAAGDPTPLILDLSPDDPRRGLRL